MRKAQAASATTPKTVKTDKLRSYEVAVENVWGGDVQHVQSEGIRAELNNNLSERLQDTFIQTAYKEPRGLDKASRGQGQAYLDGRGLTYDLFREHEGLGGKTPASAAKVLTSFTSGVGAVESNYIGESTCVVSRRRTGSSGWRRFIRRSCLVCPHRNQRLSRH